MSKQTATAVSPAPTSVRFSSCIDQETCRKIREALLVGLSSFGEIERLDNAYDIHVEIGRERIPKDLRPLHPTGSADTVGNFADALRAINTLEYVIENESKTTEGASA